MRNRAPSATGPLEQVEGAERVDPHDLDRQRRSKSVGLAGEAKCMIASNRPASAAVAGSGSVTSASTSVNRGWSARCATLSLRPVTKLSTATTVAAAGDQRIDEVGPDEAGTAGDQDAVPLAVPLCNNDHERSLSEHRAGGRIGGPPSAHSLVGSSSLAGRSVLLLVVSGRPRRSGTGPRAPRTSPRRCS